MKKVFWDFYFADIFLVSWVTPSEPQLVQLPSDVWILETQVNKLKHFSNSLQTLHVFPNAQKSMVILHKFTFLSYSLLLWSLMSQTLSPNFHLLLPVCLLLFSSHMHTTRCQALRGGRKDGEVGWVKLDKTRGRRERKRNSQRFLRIAFSHTHLQNKSLSPYNCSSFQEWDGGINSRIPSGCLKL